MSDLFNMSDIADILDISDLCGIADVSDLSLFGQRESCKLLGGTLGRDPAVYPLTRRVGFAIRAL